MANHRITMKQLRKFLGYHLTGKSKRQIATLLQISRHTIDNYLGYLKAEVGDDLTCLLSWEEDALQRLVTHHDEPTTKTNLESLFPLYEKELSKVGVTRLML